MTSVFEFELLAIGHATIKILESFLSNMAWYVHTSAQNFDWKVQLIAGDIDYKEKLKQLGT